MKFKLFGLFASITVLLVSNVYAGEDLPAGVAAVVNGQEISNAVVDQALKANLRGQPETAEARNAIKRRLIDIALLSQQAHKEGLDRTPEAKSQLLQLQSDFLADLAVTDYIKKNPISDADVQSEYDREVKALGADGLIREYKISDIVVASEADALSALIRIKKGESFDKVARNVSLSPSKAQGGASGWIQANQIPQPMAQLIATLGKGEVSSKPVQIGNGWLILKIDDRRTVKPPTLAEASNPIRTGLIQIKEFEYIAKLRESAKITQ